ncbi:hypothetical protein BDV59DRAFT_65303 [Aspergillus ambiguus]|uniref:Zn(II)2Cys6 transcription factor domain-containing protein n=1 Tax=Aspergillus ambiguus TaxID=176160 RepID=UPI003CCE23F1
MYKPAPPRPKKTNISRSRNGCKSCRNRKTKCDEKKPAYGTCVRLGKSCEYVQLTLKYRHVTVQHPKIQSPCAARPQSVYERTAIQSGGSVPRGDIIRSLKTAERDIFYYTYWEDRCLPALNPIFHHVTASLTADNPILNDAILALSSCHISRLHYERRTSSTGPMGPLSPSLAHQIRSHLYYSSAIRRLASMKPSDYHHHSTVVLIVLVLFAHLESAMGNFQGFYCHVQGMMDLLESHEAPNSMAFSSLLTSWMQIRYVVWWARAYFSSLDIHRQLPCIPLPVSINHLHHTPHWRRVKVLSIMCESHRLNYKAVLQRFKSWRSRRESRRETDGDYADCTALLRQEAVKLDEWLWHLPPSEHPIYELKSTGHTTISFHTCSAALNYAYYVVARIMQCTGLLQLLCNPSATRNGWELCEEEAWVRMLVQIAQGADMQASMTNNSYTIGFSGLLLAGILRCQTLSVGLAIQDWLQELMNLQPTEEGAFPVYQTLSTVKAINRQRMVDQDVFAATQPVDDGGGTPKITAYNSQSISCLLLHGRSRKTGDLFEECITLSD